MVQRQDNGREPQYTYHVIYDDGDEQDTVANKLRQPEPTPTSILLSTISQLTERVKTLEDTIKNMEAVYTEQHTHLQARLDKITKEVKARTVLAAHGSYSCSILAPPCNPNAPTGPPPSVLRT